MRKLYSVQYLRALAAFLVLVAHAFSYQLGVDNPLVVAAGRLGVILFFAISGFIMVYISGHGSFSAPSFLRRRAIRIIPLYWIFTSLAAALAALAPSLFQSTIFTWPHYLQSLFFIVHETPLGDSVSPILSLGWTLNYEIYFYVVFAALAALSAFWRIGVLTALFGGLWLAGLAIVPADPVVQFYLNASPLAFVAGAWIGRHYLNGGFEGDGRSAWLLAVASVLGAGIALLDDGSVMLGQISFVGQVVWGVSLLCLGLMVEPRIRHWRLLEQLGDASYALYLSHIFVIGAVTYGAKRFIGSGQPMTVLLVSLISVAVAIVASLMIHQMVERPILRLLSGRRPARPSSLGALPLVHS